MSAASRDAPPGPDATPPAVPFVRPHGRYERLAYERHARDLELSLQPEGHPAGYWFDSDSATRAEQFIERHCRHHKGEFAGRLFLLSSSQRFAVRTVFGWKRRDGSRRFRVVYVETGRKSGKSELAAAIAAYLLIADGEEGGEVYATATKEEQAKIVWEASRAMIKASPDLRRWVTVRQKQMSCARLGSIYRPLGADSDTLDGLNPSGHICDEIHKHKSRSVWEVMLTGQGARRQPLNWAITTAGVYDPESLGWELHTHAQQVLDGVVEDEAFFAIIFAVDAEDMREGEPWWQREELWAKANPQYPVTPKPEFLRDQARRATQIPSELNSFLRLHLGVWTQQLSKWLSVERWNACARPGRTLEDFRGREVFLGLDLSTKVDITGVAMVVPFVTRVVEAGVERAVRGYEFAWRFWVPEQLVQERARRALQPDYAAWVRDGHLNTTPGSGVDYEFIRREILALRSVVRIRQIGYDPWNANEFATQLEKEGFRTDAEATHEQLVEMRQGMRTLSEPAKEFERLLLTDGLIHDGNPVMRWMVDNAVVRRDANDNIAPDKASAVGKIDGVVASIMALGRAMLAPAVKRSVYEDRGVVRLGAE